MPDSARKRLEYGDYSVALICPLEVEMSAARYLLDEEHSKLSQDRSDPNLYILGRLSGHNAVVASFPEGSQGTVSAATVAAHLTRTFPAIQLRLLVGIGGGVPTENDIRLGDVVVSAPVGTSGGVIEYDLGKQTPAGFERKGFLCPLPTEWRSAITNMKSDHRTKSNRIDEFLSGMLGKYPQLKQYQRPPSESDILFQQNYEHDRKETTCANCDKYRVVNRPQRPSPNEPAVFYGLIASGNRVMKDAAERDKISKDAGGALCFEMEAAGLMNDFRCIVIRGISDYSDSHKNDDWHAYAAAAAAGLAKEILCYIDPIKEKVVLKRNIGIFFNEGSAFQDYWHEGYIITKASGKSLHDEKSWERTCQLQEEIRDILLAQSLSVISFPGTIEKPQMEVDLANFMQEYQEELVLQLNFFPEPSQQQALFQSMLRMTRGQIDKDDETRRTLLHWLAMNGVAFLIPKLIEIGFDVNGKESDYRTPLHLAVIGNHFPAVECLVKHGANVHAKDLKNMLPWSLALIIDWDNDVENDERIASKRSIIRLLAQHTDLDQVRSRLPRQTLQRLKNNPDADILICC